MSRDRARGLVGRELLVGRGKDLIVRAYYYRETREQGLN